MATKSILVVFDSVRVLDDSDFWGPGEWKFDAKADGQQIGDPNQEFEAREGSWIQLPDRQWTKRLDVTGKTAGDTVVISFRGTEVDTFFDDDIGQVRVTLRWPFQQDFNLTLPASKVSGLFSSTRYFELLMRVYDIPEDIATLEFAPAIVVSRGASGSGRYTAFSMGHMTPRVEICAVTPTPNNLPPRPVFPVDFPRGRASDAADPVEITPSHDLNTLVNPAFIPVLSATDPNLRTKAARIVVTYMEPHNTSTEWFYWHIKSGPIAFVDTTNLGRSEVLVRGTGSSSDPDRIAEIELRWSGPSGPLFATFRAWVGGVKSVFYRINLINGVDPVNHPGRSPNMTPDDVHRYVRIARVMFWQAGLEFKPDPDSTCWDGARATPRPAVYIVPASSDTWTNNVPMSPSPIASRLNFNPGVLNLTFVRSHVKPNAFASDIRGVSGANQVQTGSPSTSWVRPSGIAPDAAAGTVTMLTFPNRPRSNGSDAAYVTARQAVQAGFTAADLQLLYACMYPSVWGATLRTKKDLIRAQNLVHELGHVLGLRHRGNGKTHAAPLSNDGVNTIDATGNQRGHPWQENIMCYGRDRSLDIDLIQVPVIRRHPAARP